MSSTRVFGRHGGAVSVVGILIAAAAAAGLPGDAIAAPAARPVESTAISDQAGSTTALKDFAIQSSKDAGDSGEKISSPDYRPDGWHPAGPRSTVMAALVADGTYPDPFFSTNMDQPKGPFQVPWWFRSEFTVNDTSARTYLNIEGILSAADVFVNGKKIAGADEIAGVYPRYERDITDSVKTGANSVAFRVQPNDAKKDLTIGWIDWNPSPADNNMGMFRDIVIRRAGAVSLDDAHVMTAVDPSLTSADLTVKAKVRNTSDNTVTTTVSGAIGEVRFSKDVTLAAGETQPVEFNAADTSQLRFADPQIWWPAGMGEHPLYDLKMTAETNGVVTDTAQKRFGIRTIEAPINKDGAREYFVNGKRTLIRGANDSTDILLRWNAQEAADRFTYALNMGINAIRLEGRLEPDEFFEMADKVGMMLLPGWECCNKWEEVKQAGPPTPLEGRDLQIAKDSMVTVAAELRNHPSVVSFLIGSDFAPLEATGQAYREALEGADWQLPVISDIDGKTSAGYQSGMKMVGPYEWVPPVYWYAKQIGGAEGFNSETSSGVNIPTLDTLRRMLSPAELEELWKHPEAIKYHRSPTGAAEFQSLAVFANAMNNRYGKPASLEEFVRKAHLSQYESVRAQFEAYARNFTDADRPSTGQIFFLLNSPWTSLHWQLFDRYFDQEGSYFGTQKANEELHIQYSYDDRSVVVINQRNESAAGLTAHVDLYNMDGSSKFHQDTPVDSAPGNGGKAVALTIPEQVDNLDTTYLAKLTLTDAGGSEVSRNVYWLSTKPEVVDWENKKDWPYTPAKSFASMEGLNQLAKSEVSATATSSTGADGQTTMTVQLTNTGGGSTPALLTDVHLVDAQNKPVLPVTWSNNQVTLWPGESVTLTAWVRTDILAGATPKLRVSGWNLDTTTADVSAS
ncbi:glycosyl hydrolase 2 galactose-binding domain-containing protein [Nocardia sp. NPDC004722]